MIWQVSFSEDGGAVSKVLTDARQTVQLSW